MATTKEKNTKWYREQVAIAKVAGNEELFDTAFEYTTSGGSEMADEADYMAAEIWREELRERLMCTGFM